jgi:hypothetical protein
MRTAYLYVASARAEAHNPIESCDIGNQMTFLRSFNLPSSVGVRVGWLHNTHKFCKNCLQREHLRKFHSSSAEQCLRESAVFTALVVGTTDYGFLGVCLWQSVVWDKRRHGLLLSILSHNHPLLLLLLLLLLERQPFLHRSVDVIPLEQQ